MDSIGPARFSFNVSNSSFKPFTVANPPWPSGMSNPSGYLQPSVTPTACRGPGDKEKQQKATFSVFQLEQRRKGVVEAPPMEEEHIRVVLQVQASV